jgi:hypothetical protein
LSSHPSTWTFRIQTLGLQYWSYYYLLDVVPNDQSNPSITPSHLTWGIDSKLTYPELIISFWQCWLIRTTIAYLRYHSDAPTYMLQEKHNWKHILLWIYRRQLLLK